MRGNDDTIWDMPLENGGRIMFGIYKIDESFEEDYDEDIDFDDEDLEDLEEFEDDEDFLEDDEEEF